MAETFEVVQEVTVDVSKSIPAPTVFCKQADNVVRVLRVTIQDNKEDYTIPAGFVARLRGTKADGTRIYLDARSAAANVTEFILTQNALAAHGKATCEVELSNSAGDVVKSCNLVLNVQKTAMDDSAVESTDEFKSLEAAAAGAQAAQKAAEDAASKTADDAQSAAQSAADAKEAVKTAGDAASKVINEGVAEKMAEVQAIQDDVTAKQAQTATDAAAAAEAKTAAEAAQADAAASKTAAADSATAAKESEEAAAQSTADAKEAAQTATDAASKVINEGVAEKLAEMQAIQDDVTAKQTQTATDAEAAAKAKTAAEAAQADAAASKTAAADSATAAKESEEAAAQSANAAAASAAAAQAVGATFYGVDFFGSTSAGTRTGAAADFVFTPGTDTVAGQNDFDGVYPWAGMRRCCCTLNADGTVTVNAYKGQPGYIEDGTNGEVLVEVPLFYVAGMLDVSPWISAVPMPGFRAPRKFRNSDGSLKQRCYLPAFSGSIGSDGKLHSIAGVVPTGNKNITQFMTAARQWGEAYSIGTSADFEVLAYLMIVVYGTRNFQAKINGVVSLYSANIAITGARTDEAAVTIAKGVLEPGMVISIGTGGENESVAYRRIVTAVEAINGDTANVKVSFSGDPVTTTTSHKVWRIMQSTGTANSMVATCGSPVSNTDGRHSFVFYGVENPLYGNQWRMECDWKLIDGVPYYCDDPTKYQWTSANDYTKLDGLELPGEGWPTALQADERFPRLQITKSIGGSSSTYLADYFWVDKSGTRIARRGGTSSYGGDAGPWSIALHNDAGLAWWDCSADLSVPG